MNYISILIASKNTMFREGIAAVLREDPSIKIVGEACNLEDAIDTTDRLHPHIVLLDAVLTEESTLEAIHRIRQSHERIGILVLNVSGRLKATARLLKAGASMYVSPETRIDQLRDLIRATYLLGRQESIHNGQPRSRQIVRNLRPPDSKASMLREERAGSRAGLPAIAQTNILRTRNGRSG